MGIVNKVTQAVSRVSKSRDAGEHSVARQLLRDSAQVEDNYDIHLRYNECADCPHVKEEFKLLGVTVKEETPTCAECGCNLLLKIPMVSQSCPLGKW